MKYKLTKYEKETTVCFNEEEIKFEKKKAHTRYRLADGTVVPGVTTVLSVIAKPQLIHWAWDLGMKGQDFRKVRDGAADVGTIAHFMAECYLKDKLPDLTEFSPADVSLAENSFIKFMEFWDGEGFSLLNSETELVHEVLRYGGKLDVVAKDQSGKVCLIDIKSSKAIYDEHWAQISAYRELYPAPIQRHIIVRVGKTESMDLEVQERNDLLPYFRLFRAALELYNAQKGLK